MKDSCWPTIKGTAFKNSQYATQAKRSEGFSPKDMRSVSNQVLKRRAASSWYGSRAETKTEWLLQYLTLSLGLVQALKAWCSAGPIRRFVFQLSRQGSPNTAAFLWLKVGFFCSKCCGVTKLALFTLAPYEEKDILKDKHKVCAVYLPDLLSIMECKISLVMPYRWVGIHNKFAS